jgi:hypothetical protein
MCLSGMKLLTTGAYVLSENLPKSQFIRRGEKAVNR